MVKTWEQRCQEHPNHQSGMVSDKMIQARMQEEIEDLRAALAQPEPEPYKGDVTRIMRDAGMTFHLGLPHKVVIEQMTRVVDLAYAEASIKAAQKFAVALAQPEQLVVGGDDLPTLTKWTPQRNTLPLSDDEIKCIKPICADFVSFRAGVRHAEREHGIGGEA